MGIKRGVSSYSYQQAMFFGQMNWKGFLREVREGLGTDGIEIIDAGIIRDYPFPSDAWVYDFRNEMARYNLTATTMDVYLDVHQFRDHVMNYDEAALRLCNDIKLAARLGFKNVRCLCLVPIDVIERALPTAEKYDVRIGKEIHAPLSIKYGASASKEKELLLDPRSVDQIIDLAEKYHTKHAALVPDMGIFQFASPAPRLAQLRRTASIPEAIDFAMENSKQMSTSELLAALNERYPGHSFGNDEKMLSMMFPGEMCSQPEDIKDIIPYICSIHGKFYNMVEDPNNPGHYMEDSIDYPNVIRCLKEGGFDGYINSEFEGQSMYQDLPREQLVDEVEQVRRQHSMLRDLIGE